MKKKWYADGIRKREGVDVAYGHTTIPGCLVFEARWHNNPCAIGTVWYSWRGKATIEIHSSYVINHYRRLGVRTFIHEEMIRQYPNLRAIVTGEGTKDSTPWLKAMGFKRNAEDGWKLVVKRKS